MKLNFFVKEQQLSCVDKPIIMSGTINYLCAKFIFRSADWAEINSKWAHFRRGDEVFDMRLDQNDCIPQSAGLSLSEGAWEVYLHGDRIVDGEVTQRITTDTCSFEIAPCGMLEGEPLPPVAPSAAEQIEAIAVEARYIADKVRQDANSGAFIGPEGPRGPQGPIGPVGPTGPKGERGDEVVVTIDAEGTDLILRDSADVGLRNLMVFGRSVQDAEPTPDAPQEIESVENVTIRIADSESNIMQEVIVPHVLRGLPVSSDGNYTDANGQQWICDEVDFERGVLVQRIAAAGFDGSADEVWKREGTKTAGFYRWSTAVISSKILPATSVSALGVLLNSHYPVKTANNTYSLQQGAAISNKGVVYVYDSNFANSELADWQAHLSENPLFLHCAWLTPIEIPLTEEELAAYASMRTVYPTTVVTNDQAAHMEVSFVADTETLLRDMADTTEKQRVVLKQTQVDVNDRVKKFFTNNLGETNVTDSDDGYMRNTVFGGKSVQDAEPTPDAPQEIRSVENVGVRICGNQLFNASAPITSAEKSTCEFDGNILTVTGTENNTGNVYHCVRWDYDISRFAGLSNLTLSVKKMTAIGSTTPAAGVRTYDINGQELSNYTINSNKPEPRTFPLDGVVKIRILAYATSGSAITKGEGAIYEGIMLNAGTAPLPYQPYTEQSVIIPHTLRGLPVSSGGNYTDKNGQQWICDEVDFERGVLVQRTQKIVLDGSQSFTMSATSGAFQWAIADTMVIDSSNQTKLVGVKCDQYRSTFWTDIGTHGNDGCALRWGTGISLRDSNYKTVADFKNRLIENPVTVVYLLNDPIETPLSAEEIEAYKALLTHYGGTNIFFESANGVEPNLDFDYPCAMDSFVEYIKEQIGDTRTFVYNMDSRLSDEEYLSALAYVNSEYAAALLELEV